MTASPGRHRFLPALLSVAACVMVVAVLFALRDGSLSRVRAAGVFRVGYATEEPYAFLTADGEVTGESPEVAKVIAARLNLPPIEWRQVPFDGLIVELLEGRVDMIAAGMFVTAGRARQIAFSEPTFHVRPGLLVARGNPLRVQSYRQAVAQSGIKLATLSGSVEEVILKQMGLPASRLVIVPDALTGRVAVESGVVYGLALSSPTVRWMALQDRLGRTEVVADAVEPDSATANSFGYGAFAFRKSDRRLLAAWNAAQNDFVGTPEHRKLIGRFGFTDAEQPGTVSLGEILAR